MKDFDDIEYFAPAEKLVKILCQKTQNPSPQFFRVLVGYYFSKVASMMRVTIKTHDRGTIPVNMYAINLAPSGYGKGLSTNIIEEQVINQFKDRFIEETFPKLAEINISKLACRRAARSGEDVATVEERTIREFNVCGPLLFSFDGGTTAAVKQTRHKLLMAHAGSMNMEIDEIGSNLLGNVDVLNAFLELYDVGKIKQKLTKNTTENLRNEEIDGRTPTNMMLYGTPSKLFDGGKVEAELVSSIEAGFGRRCFFGFAEPKSSNSQMTPEEVYDMLTDTSSANYLDQISDMLGDLADRINFGVELDISKDNSLLGIKYKLDCERRADMLSEHEAMRKAEMCHRYFKVLKLAGTYAFIDGSPEVTEDHMYNAIKLAEESGKAFSKLLTRERNYVKLAKYIANLERKVTNVDLIEDLPFYKGTAAAKAELMTFAIAYGYQNNIIIKKHYTDGIEFISGESLKDNNMKECIFSYSTDIATGYENVKIPFTDLSTLTQANGYHWTSHHILDGHRRGENMIAGTNTIVLDVDKGVDIKTAQLLLQDYTYHMYTTKRHTDACNRFRVVMPLSHNLKLDEKDFKEFMNNIYTWLPFEVDAQTNQRSRKWLSHQGQHWDNDGQTIDALLFIPKTAKSEERKVTIKDQQSLNNIERWFINNTGEGNRSNQLIRYALLLVDSGKDIVDVRLNLLELNKKIDESLDEQEIAATIMVTVAQAIYKRDNK
jgi:hypothetical protein